MKALVIKVKVLVFKYKRMPWINKLEGSALVR